MLGPPGVRVLRAARPSLCASQITNAIGKNTKFDRSLIKLVYRMSHSLCRKRVASATRKRYKRC